MFFNSHVYAIPKECPSTEQITQLEEGCSPHPKQLNAVMTVIAMVNEPKIGIMFFIPSTQWSIAYTSSGGGQTPKSDK